MICTNISIIYIYIYIYISSSSINVNVTVCVNINVDIMKGAGMLSRFVWPWAPITGSIGPL